ncbi:MAG: hypothetical protein VX899_12765 [Myxococcota bacterium]|nr:hypothetical protein [Myxococcota bacterium]
MNTPRQRIQFESQHPDGLLVSLRMATPVPQERFLRLQEDLEHLTEELEGATVLERDLAGALHALSFHLEGCAAALRQKGLLPADLDELLPLIYIQIDEIFQT